MLTQNTSRSAAVIGLGLALCVGGCATDHAHDHARTTPQSREAAKERELRIREIIAEQGGLELAQVTPNARFIEDLGFDSLGAVELIMALEEEYGLEIPDEDAEKVLTVADAVDYIQSHVGRPTKHAK